MREPEADGAERRGEPCAHCVGEAAQRVAPERQLFGERGEQEPGAERESGSPPARPVSRVRDGCAADQHREPGRATVTNTRSEEHTSELQSLTNLVCRLLPEKKNTNQYSTID